MAYRIAFLQRAERELRRIRDQRTYTRLRDSISSLGEDPRPRGARKLSGREAWRIRVGDMRILYEIEDDVLLVTVLAIRHRSDAYR